MAIKLEEIQFDEIDLIKSISRESFYCFVQEFWDTAVTREPVWNWHIKYLCNELQKIAEQVFENQPREYDLIINVPPGSTKSTMTSIMFPAWVWTRMPEAQFVTASYAKDLAMDLSRRTRDIVMSEKYKAAFSDIQLRFDQNVKTHYMNTEGGFRIAVGTGGVTGFHGHFILIDDPIDPNEALSEAELKSANIWMSETLSQRKVDKELTPTILIMQRLHQDDPTAHMLDTSIEGKIKHICLPAELSDDIKPKELSKYYVDGLLDPVRLNRKVLEENYKKLAEYGYAGQMLQNPKPRGGGMFKTERIRIDQAPTSWTMRVRYWDKAGTQEKAGTKAAYTVGVLLGKNCDGRYWILDVKRGRWDSSARENVIKQTAESDGKSVIIGIEQEGGSGGKESAEATVRNLAGYRIRVDRPTGDKALRADPFSAQVNTGNVSMVRAEWNTDYLNELSFFPLSTYKDQVDASSGAFNQLSKPQVFVGGGW